MEEDMSLQTVPVTQSNTQTWKPTPKIIKEKLEWKRLKFNGIKEYFRNRPNDLLVMNICNGEGWKVLCPFLDKSIPDVQFPKKNITKNYED